MKQAVARLMAGLVVVASTIVGIGAVMTPAVAAPGSPGTPSDPVVVFHEDFENGLGDTDFVLLRDYAGAQGTTYSGTPYWTEPTMCNGIVISQAASAPAECTTVHIRNLAETLGQLNGSANSSFNHAVSAYTNLGTVDFPLEPGDIEFETEQPVTVPAGARFLTFAVNAASVNCHSTAALLRFYLKDGATEIPATNTPINVCTDPRSETFGGHRYGSFTSDSSVLFSGTQLDIVMRNDNGSAAGNDHAYDDIKVLDATPQLDKSFGTRALPWVTGEAVPLTFTVTNTSELAEKTGWEFTDTLPTGLTVADASPTTTCAAGTIDAGVGAAAFSVTGGSIATGVTSCTITVHVTAAQGAEFTNGPGNVTTTGLDNPGETTVTIVQADPSLRLDKIADLEDTNGNGFADLGEEITYTFEVENTGNAILTDVAITDPRVAGVTPTTVSSLAPGAVTSFTSAAYEVTQADVDAGGVFNTATASGFAPGGGTVTSPPDSEDVPGPPRVPGLSIEKTSVFVTDANADGLADLDDVLEYRFDVENTGTVTVTGVTVVDPKVSGITPAMVDLAPGQTQRFTAQYTVTQVDVDSGATVNVASATGTTPLGPLTSVPDENRVDGPDPDPNVSIVKSAVLTTDAGTPDRADVDDVITYTFTVSNAGPATAFDVSVIDDLPGLSAISPASVSSIAPGDEAVFTATYVVAQADVDRGQVTNQAAGRFLPPDPDPNDGQTPDPRFTPPSLLVNVPAVDPDPGLDIDKVADLDDTNGNGRADVDEQIVYSFVLENTGNVTLTGVTVSDAMVDILTPALVDLAPGEVATITAAPYVVTQGDVDTGEVANTATARGSVPGGAEIVSDPDTEIVRTVDPAPRLAIEKFAQLHDTNGNGTADAGEQISYRFVVSNTGNVTLADVTVTDPRVTGLDPQSVGRLSPGGAANFTAAAYTVTDADVAAGSVVNVASATGTPPQGPAITSEEATATTPTTPAPASSGDLPTTGTSLPLGVLPAAVLVLMLGLIALRLRDRHPVA